MAMDARNDLSPAEVLESERAVNEHYRNGVNKQVVNSSRAGELAASPANTRWVEQGPRSRLSSSIVGSVVGRVGFLNDVDGIHANERGFYVGPGHEEWTAPGDHEVLVVSWAAPAAQLFYKRETADAEAARLLGIPDVPGVARSVFAGVRTFETHADDIERYEDDLVPDCPPSWKVFPLGGPADVAVPSSPGPVRRPTRRTVDPFASDTGSKSDGSRRAERATSVHEAREADPSAHASEDPSAEKGTKVRQEHANAAAGSLRAATIVKSAVERPRTGRLGSLIATLQQDQYDLVAWPSNVPLIVQGQPGTGKTIIATHRAAFLTHRERGENRLKSVALIGPTEAWTSHVGASLVALDADPGHYAVLDLPGMMGRLAGVQPHAMAPGREIRFDSSWTLGRFLDSAVIELTRRYGDRLRMPEVVKRLTGCDPAIRPLLRANQEIESWLADAKNWAIMSRHRRYLPALATIGRALGRGSDDAIFDHILIDEAQDVRDLEWRLIARRLELANSMTILGDLNQRRSDFSSASWQQLAEDLQITDEAGHVEVREVGLAYRSTRKILRFASGLLPIGTPAADCLRDGTDPVVTKVASTALVNAVQAAAELLATRHAQGIVAVISLDPKPISDRFRATGWTRLSGVRHGWQNDGRQVRVLHPDLARGLEFDAVVVVEPADFPQNIGRIGSLYTSLTRATKDLTVIHTRSLPKTLRPPRRKK